MRVPSYASYAQFRCSHNVSRTMSDYKMKKQAEIDDSATTTTMIMKNPENERILTERLGIGINLDSTRAQEDADRALMGVSGKLSRNLSVAAAVRTLVAEATDTYNLGTIFYGASSLLRPKDIADIYCFVRMGTLLLTDLFSSFNFLD